MNQIYMNLKGEIIEDGDAIEDGDIAAVYDLIVDDNALWVVMAEYQTNYNMKHTPTIGIETALSHLLDNGMLLIHKDNVYKQEEPYPKSKVKV